MTELTADRCYHWLDQQGRLCIAMASDNLSLIGGDDQPSMVMSLVFDAQPAGPGRDYRVTRRHLRMITRAGSRHRRWGSLSGIVAVWRERGGRLRGRFRIAAKQQHFSIALGWAGRGRALLVGEFLAVQNSKKGMLILKRTEANGMQRGLAPMITSQDAPAAKAQIAQPLPP